MKAWDFFYQGMCNQHHFIHDKRTLHTLNHTYEYSHTAGYLNIYYCKMRGKNEEDILHDDGGGDDHILRPKISLQKKDTYYASDDDKKDNYDDEIQCTMTIIFFSNTKKIFL